MIPLVDLNAQHDKIRKELDAAIAQIIDSSSFIMGPAVKELEAGFAAFCGSKFSVGCSSGTSALQLALEALGVGPGDEVITIPHTFIATIEAVSQCGAKPVFVDIDPATYTMNVDLLEKAITPRTKVVIPVHLYGHITDMDPLMEIANRRGLKVVEDCAQAHGAEYKGKKAGTFGDAGCFSFFPAKNLGAFGDAGAITTNDEALAKKMSLLRNHGRQAKYEHDMIGYNDRIDTLHAAILNVKLKYLAGWNDARRANAQRYNEALKGSSVETPIEKDWAKHVYHLYVIQHSNRDALQEHLKEAGIATGVHYPIPLHLQPAYKFLGHKKGEFPVTEAAAERILSLPMYPELSADQIAEIAAAIKSFQG